jgi:hypothetical protein
MHIRSRIGKTQNSTPKAPQRRGERRGKAESLLKGSFLSLLPHKVPAFFAPPRWRKLTLLAAALSARRFSVIATTFQKWPAMTFFLIAAFSTALVAGSRAWVGSENHHRLPAPIREPLQVVRFTLYDVGIYPREAVADKGVIAISIDDLSGGSEGLVLERETGVAIAQVRREGKQRRGRGEIKLTPGRYRVYDASRPSNSATLIVEP